jgi:hypothetical protein
VLGGTPALVVLDRELDLVLAQHGLGQFDRPLVTLEARLERLVGVELPTAWP